MLAFLVFFALTLVMLAFLVFFALTLVVLTFFVLAVPVIIVRQALNRQGLVSRFHDNPRGAVFQCLKGAFQPGLKLQPVHHHQVRRPDRPQV